MSLWGKTDTAGAAPKSLSADEKQKVYFVDTDEAAVASAQQIGLGTPGWNLYTTYTDSDGATRHRAETLVPMKVASGDAGDTGAALVYAPDLDNGVTYIINEAGTTDFTQLGAANNDVGTSFVADTSNTGALTGTGSVILAAGDDSILPDA